jgi:hypothetical protein
MLEIRMAFYVARPMIQVRVFKLILSIVSPFFKDMIGLTPEASAIEVEIIPIPEDSSVAAQGMLLHFFCPCAAPAIEIPDELHVVIN